MYVVTGSKILKPGELCGKLTKKTAEETGLLVGTPVATAVTDGQCGGLGLVGCNASSLSTDLTSRIGKCEVENLEVYFVYGSNYITQF